MAGKTLVAARQYREKLLLEFQSVCDDLEEELDIKGAKQPNERRLKNKISLVKNAYDQALDAHASVITLEKTSAADELNRNWVKSNLRKQFKQVIEAGEDKLLSLGFGSDLEQEAKSKVASQKLEAQCDLAMLETRLKASIESLTQVVADTTIWLSDNHSAVTERVIKLEDELFCEHVKKCKVLLSLLSEEDVEVESKKQLKSRSDMCTQVADLRIKLASKTPSKSVNTSSGGQVHVAQAGAEQAGIQQQGPIKAKVKMAAMPIPRFSGKVVDYPEWRRLFKDCVESQYEESATVMTLRTQALPDNLVSMVPRCTDLANVWDKLDKKFLDPSIECGKVSSKIYLV